MVVYYGQNGAEVVAVHSFDDGTEVHGKEYRVNAGPLSIQIGFQLGAVEEVGVNGTTADSLIMVVAHHLRATHHPAAAEVNKLLLEAVSFLRKENLQP